jgi:hypothetical protein
MSLSYGYLMRRSALLKGNFTILYNNVDTLTEIFHYYNGLSTGSCQSYQKPAPR